MNSRSGRRVTPDEAGLWRSVTRDVRPLDGRPKPADEPTKAEPATEPVLAPLHRPHPPLRPAPPLEDLTMGIAAGLDRRTALRLKRGEMAVDGRIDLHGMTQEQAHAALVGFVTRAYESGRRCLLVITGKGRDGTGILRAQVPRWLNQPTLRPLIIGLSVARPNDGGEGALYLLVRRKRL